MDFASITIGSATGGCLERPLDNFLKSDVDMPFCLCWANENWTRTWDGDTKSILLEQKYAEDDEEKFIVSLMPFFSDSRYIRVDGKPMLVVYRINELPDPATSVLKWRAAAAKGWVTRAAYRCG